MYMCQNQIYDTENSIVFRDKLDLILNNTISKNKPDGVEKMASRLDQWNEVIYDLDDSYTAGRSDDGKDTEHNDQGQFIGGILLPKQNENSNREYADEGSGNIIIVGDYGTGKTTLAIQIAAACADKINDGIAVYYSLEIDRTQIIENYIAEDNKHFANKLFYFPNDEERDNLTDQRLSERLAVLLNKSDESKINRQIVFPCLSPKGIHSPAPSNDLFVKRYKEVQYMLRGIVAYNHTAKEKGDPLIKAVIIDSLNVFGDKVLSREEVYRLFSLFKQNQILGIFTLEKNDFGNPDVDTFVNSTKFMADVVISLIKSEYNHYIQTYLEVEKSRNVPQVYGKHPYKIRDVKEGSKTIRKKIVVYPSLHYIVYGTEKKKQSVYKSVNRKSNLFGINAFSNILPEYFQVEEYSRTETISTQNNILPTSRIISITGESGLFKSDLAINAVLYGLAMHEDGLIIHLSDRTLFCENGVRFNQEVFDVYSTLPENRNQNNNMALQLVQEDIKIDEETDEEHKYVLSSWIYPSTDARLFEIVFKSGALLPEEFIDIVCRIINKNLRLSNNTGIKNIAFIDLKAIGICYPFLIDSETSGEMFIPTFIHIMRNYGINVFFSSSLSGIKQSDDVVHKAVGLSDAVVKCEKDKEYEQLIFIKSPMTVIQNKTVTVSLCPEDSIDQKKGFSIYKDQKCVRQMPQLQMFNVKNYSVPQKEHMNN